MPDYGWLMFAHLCELETYIGVAVWVVVILARAVGRGSIR